MNWNFFSRQILNSNSYDASVFEIKFIFKKLDSEEKKIFKKHDFDERIFLKAGFQKKNCAQKIVFCLILPRNMRKFCVLRAYLKSTILKEK